MKITNQEAAELALHRLIATIENTDGVFAHPDGTHAPVADPEWLDLGAAYLLACGAVGKSPIFLQTIAAQDAALPSCPGGKCQTCQGSELRHHWMLDSFENEENPNDPRNGEMFLQCRHCYAQIHHFDSNDPNCPEY